MLPILLPLQTYPAYALRSPDGLLAAQLAVEPGGRPTLAVLYRGRRLLAPGRLGLELTGEMPLDAGLRVVSERERAVDSTWTAISGKTSRVRDHYREMTLDLARGERRLTILVRAYDDGVAFRYRVPRQSTLSGLAVREERTTFRPEGDPKATALVLPNANTPYEEPYKVADLESLDGALIGFPLLLQWPQGPAVAFTEADLNDFGGLYLVPKDGTLQARLSPRLDGSGLAAKGSLPHDTPWRVVMVGDPTRLLESNLVLNLNPPSVLKDTSWIHPGKTLFPWWNGYDTGDTGIAPAQTTAYHKWCIDFAAAHGIPYHSLDGLDNLAWYGGRIVPYDGGPLTKGLPGLDLEEIVRYAKTKGVRIRLWMASAAAKAQMDVAYPYYERLGIEGVMVDFFDHDDQDTVDLVRRIVETAARCHLTVTLHNLYKPTGLQRTYPNLLTFEAARNLEYDKWDPAGITPEHEMRVAFVRALAGPIDFHAGSFRNVAQADFRPVDKAPVTIGTRARQLARYVVFEDAMNMVADSPAVYAASPAGFSFLAEVPTTWDETRVLMGEVGRVLVTARRKGRVWYLGAMTDGSPRRLTVPLAFLGRGRYAQESWTDGARPTDVRIEKADAGASATLDLAAAGGAAMRFTPK